MSPRRHDTRASSRLSANPIPIQLSVSRLDPQIHLLVEVVADPQILRGSFDGRLIDDPVTLQCMHVAHPKGGRRT